MKREEVIEEAAKRLLKDVNPKHGRPVSSQLASDIRLVAGAVFEKAHTHECEMCRWENGFGARKPLTHTCEKNLSTDDFPHGHPEMDPTDDAQEALDYLDEMNEAGRIEYDDYRNLHDLISGAVEPAREIFPGTLAALDDLTTLPKKGQER